MGLQPQPKITLANKCKRFEVMYDANCYTQQGEILDSIQEHPNDTLTDHRDDTPLSVSECREVWDILEMYRTLMLSYEKLVHQDGVDVSQIRFAGFDYSNSHEAKLGDYAKYILLVLDKYEELKYGKKDRIDFDSHRPMLNLYRAMLNEWSKSVHQYNLSKEDILRIVNATSL